MFTELQSGYNAARSLFEIAKGVQALKTETAINSAILEIQRLALDTQNSLFEANTAYSERVKEIGDLKQEVMSLKAWDGEAERYELKQYHPGTLTYTLKAVMADGQPVHHLCANCYNERKKSILQAEGNPRSGGYRHYKCSRCETAIPIGSEINQT